MNLKLIKETEKGKNYQADDFKIFYRNKNVIVGDNECNPHEVIYLITGEVEATLKNEIKIVRAPAVIEFPANTYHKMYTLSDISFVLFEK